MTPNASFPNSMVHIQSEASGKPIREKVTKGNIVVVHKILRHKPWTFAKRQFHLSQCQLNQSVPPYLNSSGSISVTQQQWLVIFHEEGTWKEIIELKNLAEMIDLLVKQPLKHHPGECYTYGMSTAILGRAIEIISGQDFASFLEKEIFHPLGMEETSFHLNKIDSPNPCDVCYINVSQICAFLT